MKETDEPKEEKEIRNPSFWSDAKMFSTKQIQDLSDEMVHQLTHQKIKSRVLHVCLDEKIKLEGYQWASLSQRKKLAFPRMLTRYLENNQ